MNVYLVVQHGYYDRCTVVAVWDTLDAANVDAAARIAVTKKTFSVQAHTVGASQSPSHTGVTVQSKMCGK